MLFSILFLIFFTKEKEENLPRLYIEGNLKEMVSKKDVRKVKVLYRDKNNNFKSYATLKVQGDSSLSYEKKNYKIELYHDSNMIKDNMIDLRWGKYNKYCLKANWTDKTHSRNIVTANLMARIQNKFNLFANSPNNGLIDGYPIEIYNNGTFLGLYTLNLNKDERLFDYNSEVKIIMEASNWNSDSFFQSAPTRNTWELKTDYDKTFSYNKFSELVDFIINSSDEEFKNKLSDHINLDALLNYYIMVEVAGLYDNVGKNIIMASYDGDTWYPVLYDLDTSWGVKWDGKKIIDLNFVNIEHSLSNNVLFRRLLANYPEEIKERYFLLRKDFLNYSTIINEFNKFYSQIPDYSLKKEINKWGNKIPWFDLKQISGFVNKRITFLDDYMETLTY